MASTRGAALYYATEKGWPVVPVWPVDKTSNGVRCRCGSRGCRSVGKHPITRVGSTNLATKGVVDATTNEATINKWWDAVPDANIGVRGDKFFALDVDEEEGYLELIEAFGKLPDTVESLSGSGGRHILFNQPEGVILGNEEGDLPDGINVRGNRGYIIVAPSTHKSGNQYEWELSSHPRDVELADAPKWLLKLIGQPTKKVSVSVIESADSVPSLDNLDMHPSMIELIRFGPAEGVDRSSADQKVIVALLSAGLSAGEVKAVFATYPIGTEGKYSERGEEYINRSISRGVAYVGPVTKKKNKASVIVPGKRVTQHEANLERKALDTAYLAGWNAALSGNTEAISKLWPQHVGVTEGSVKVYGLGMRTDLSLDNTEREFAALVIPYRTDGEVTNIGYDIHNQPEDLPSRIWESDANSHVFNPEIFDDVKLNRVLVTEEWDTAMHTYLEHSATFSYLDILGFPSQPSRYDDEERYACLRALADMLADSEQILLAWPASRLNEGLMLADMLEDGHERVHRLTLPGTMRDMYNKFGLEKTTLNRYIQQAPLIN